MKLICIDGSTIDLRNVHVQCREILNKMVLAVVEMKAGRGRGVLVRYCKWFAGQPSSCIGAGIEASLLVGVIEEASGDDSEDLGTGIELQVPVDINGKTCVPASIDEWIECMTGTANQRICDFLQLG
jgi:hypothetical protein